MLLRVCTLAAHYTFKHSILLNKVVYSNEYKTVKHYKGKENPAFYSMHPALSN